MQIAPRARDSSQVVSTNGELHLPSKPSILRTVPTPRFNLTVVGSSRRLACPCLILLYRLRHLSCSRNLFSLRVWDSPSSTSSRCLRLSQAVGSPKCALMERRYFSSVRNNASFLTSSQESSTRVSSTRLSPMTLG